MSEDQEKEIVEIQANYNDPIQTGTGLDDI